MKREHKYKILALILSFILWYFVVWGKPIEKIIQVPIEPRLSLKGNYIVELNPSQVDVKLEATRSNLRNADIKNLKLQIDLTRYSQGVYQVRVPIESLKVNNIKIKEVTPSYIMVVIKKTEEDLIKEIPEDEEKAEDLRERVQKILCVKEGEAIAKWHPLTPPTPGINVFGEEVQPPPLKEEKNFELSDNVYLDEKERLIKAKISGVVTFEKGKIDVLPEYVLKGDVDFSVGNIYFYGKKLTIQGDVKFGFKVIVEGDLELRGCTENKVKIEVKGNFLAEGVIRGEDTTVEVWGEAKIRGAEFAKILVHGNLYVKDYLVFTNTLVEGDLIAIEGKGLIYGGEVRASGNVEVKIVGHTAQTLTIIGAGYRPDIVNDYLVTIERIEILNEVLTKIDTGLKLASKLKEEGRLTEEKLKYVEKLINERKKITEEIAKLKLTIKELSTKLTHYRNKTIKIQQKIFPNVILRIAEFTYTNNEELRRR